MIFLTFWDIYGPRIVAVAVVLIISAALIVLGRGAGRTYDRMMRRSVGHFNGLEPKKRTARFDEYAAHIEELTEKRRTARSVQLLAIGAGPLFAIGVGARTAVDFVDMPEGARWAIAAVLALVVAGGLVAWLRRRFRRRDWKDRDALTLRSGAKTTKKEKGT